MNDIYKIETYCDTCVKQIAESIRAAGGQCIVRGWAIITNYNFNMQQTSQLLHFVSGITDDLSDDDKNIWSSRNSLAAA